MGVTILEGLALGVAGLCGGGIAVAARRTIGVMCAKKRPFLP